MSKLKKENAQDHFQIMTHSLRTETKGPGDLADITGEVQNFLNESGLKEGNANLMVVGSTAGLTTIEYEPGLKKDWKELWQRLVPQGPHYAHHETWNDENGFSHLRASMLGPSIVVPFADGKLLLGTWQQIVLAEFDDRPRHREIVVQIIGI